MSRCPTWGGRERKWLQSRFYCQAYKEAPFWKRQLIMGWSEDLTCQLVFYWRTFVQTEENVCMDKNPVTLCPPFSCCCFLKGMVLGYIVRKWSCQVKKAAHLWTHSAESGLHAHLYDGQEEARKYRKERTHPWGTPHNHYTFIIWAEFSNCWTELDKRDKI